MLIASTATAQTTAPDTALPSDALIQALEDPDTRARLIEALRQTSPPSDTSATEAETAPRTMATQAAEFSQQVITEVATGAARVFSDLSRLTLLPELMTPERIANIRAELIPLVLTILVTVGAYRLARYVTARVRFERVLARGTVLAHVFVFFAQVALRLLSVLAAWVIGYGLASFAFSDGTPVLSQAI